MSIRLCTSVGNRPSAPILYIDKVWVRKARCKAKFNNNWNTAKRQLRQFVIFHKNTNTFQSDNQTISHSQSLLDTNFKTASVDVQDLESISRPIFFRVLFLQNFINNLTCRSFKTTKCFFLIFPLINLLNYVDIIIIILASSITVSRYYHEQLPDSLKTSRVYFAIPLSNSWNGNIVSVSFNRTTWAYSLMSMYRLESNLQASSHS